MKRKRKTSEEVDRKMAELYKKHDVSNFLTAEDLQRISQPVSVEKQAEVDAMLRDATIDAVQRDMEDEDYRPPAAFLEELDSRARVLWMRARSTSIAPPYCTFLPRDDIRFITGDIFADEEDLEQVIGQMERTGWCAYLDDCREGMDLPYACLLVVSEPLPVEWRGGKFRFHLCSDLDERVAEDDEHMHMLSPTGDVLGLDFYRRIGFIESPEFYESYGKDWEELVGAGKNVKQGVGS